MVIDRPVNYLFIIIKICVLIYTYIYTVCSLLRKLKQQTRETTELRRPNLVKALNQMGDFYMELKWDFHSWGKFW